MMVTLKKGGAHEGVRAGRPRKEHTMFVKFDVNYWLGKNNPCGRFEDQREAFNLAKAIAESKPSALVTLTKIVWNEDRRITSYNSCVVNPDGSFALLN